MVVQKKVVPLHSQLRNKHNPIANHIGIWCNGNTTDSGPVIPGSNPGIPTKRASFISLKDAFFYALFSLGFGIDKEIALPRVVDNSQ